MDLSCLQGAETKILHRCIKIAAPIVTGTPRRERSLLPRQSRTMCKASAEPERLGVCGYMNMTKEFKGRHGDREKRKRERKKKRKGLVREDEEIDFPKEKVREVW